jgi:BirA family biotin operon repressor/biotin-[acetyl-CoA-carboxylase] ligase
VDHSRSKPQLAWGAQALWEELRPLLPGLSVEVQARVDSTNTQLIERARADSGRPDAPVTRPGQLDELESEEKTPLGRRLGDASPCLLVAETQTRGRGRLGRGWQSSAGASLTFSLALPLAPAQWGGLSLAVGLALAQALEPNPPARPRLALKWPNDLWLRDSDGSGGRKLGGILIETVSVGQRRLCVVGVGLNITPQQFDGLAHGYACVQELSPPPGLLATAPGVLAQVAAPLVRALLKFEREGFAPLVGAFARRDLLAGQAVHVSAPQALQGVAEGVDEQGALLLRHGAVHRIVSGEVSVRLQAPGAA